MQLHPASGLQTIVRKTLFSVYKVSKLVCWQIVHFSIFNLVNDSVELGSDTQPTGTQTIVRKSTLIYCKILGIQNLKRNRLITPSYSNQKLCNLRVL